MDPVDVLAQKTRPPADTARLRAARLDSYTNNRAVITLAGGSVTDVTYLASYTPAVGDTVLVLQTAGQLIIIGRAK